ncbi:MAG: bifunctional glutamate N-acetyltransferase/amino-acid acetyltransferase ArgJ [Alphaproteobacteria bacterium]|nr:bifunctional glutamate N-acetyltransferase/amino-acid acetyltransferase ArgJ [Alphaproteobacteria bacterium]
MAHAVSPLAPAAFPALAAIGGMRLATVLTGTRYKGRDDLMFAAFVPGTAVAGVFTSNKMPGVPVDWCRKIVGAGRARGLVVNAGNANVFTGKAGVAACTATARAAADALGCKPAEIFISSTGVIGQVPDGAKLAAATKAAASRLGTSSVEDAARAIMTTDTFAKGAGAEVRIGGKTVRVAGIAKGSGMIAPAMATMLAYVFTDAAVSPAVLRTILKDVAARTFNAITVDGDTSTSDTLLAFATGMAGNKPVAKAGSAEAAALRKAIEAVCLDLAIQIAKDGEGAQKLVRVDVTGAASDAAARTIGMAIANSPLVKTAIAAADANWGRIVMAVGKSGEKADRDKLKVSVGGVTIARKGMPVPGYDEAPVARHMQGRDVHIAVDIGLGKGKARVWTCDLTHAYIDINGSYRS